MNDKTRPSPLWLIPLHGDDVMVMGTAKNWQWCTRCGNRWGGYQLDGFSTSVCGHDQDVCLPFPEDLWPAVDAAMAVGGNAAVHAIEVTLYEADLARRMDAIAATLHPEVIRTVSSELARGRAVSPGSPKLRPGSRGGSKRPPGRRAGRPRR